MKIEIEDKNCSNIKKYSYIDCTCIQITFVCILVGLKSDENSRKLIKSSQPNLFY